GQLLSSNDGTTALAWTYDNLGRWATSTRADGTYNYSYDTADQLAVATCTAGPCVDVTYSYDRAGRRTHEDSGGTADRSFEYDVTGRLTATTVDTGAGHVTTGRVLDADGHL